MIKSCKLYSTELVPMGSSGYRNVRSLPMIGRTLRNIGRSMRSTLRLEGSGVRAGSREGRLRCTSFPEIRTTVEANSCAPATRSDKSGSASGLVAITSLPRNKRKKSSRGCSTITGTRTNTSTAAWDVKRRRVHRTVLAYAVDATSDIGECVFGLSYPQDLMHRRNYSNG